MANSPSSPAYTNVPMTATDTSTVVLGDTVYTHDVNGNLTSDATFTYQYDLANQLTNVIRKADNTRVLQCRYDALGRRVEAIRADGTVDRYVYFPGSFLVLAVLDATARSSTPAAPTSPALWTPPAASPVSSPAHMRNSPTLASTTTPTFRETSLRALTPQVLLFSPPATPLLVR